MKNLLFIVVFIALAVCASAQKVYFIYLQSDNNSAFYVKMNDRIYSSTSSGYLILSSLVDSTYNFSIGFPPSQSEPRFTVRLGAKDRGFLIKNFDSGLGLFDLQNLTIINPQKDDAPKNIAYIRRNDDFSSLLSRAAKDTSLLYAVVRTKEEDVTFQEPQPRADEPGRNAEQALRKDSVESVAVQVNSAPENKKPDTLAILQTDHDIKMESGVAVSSTDEPLKKDSVIATVVGEGSKESLIDTLKNTGTDSLAIRTDPPGMTGSNPEEAVFTRSQIKKYSESSTSEGFGLVFFDIHSGGKDTIRLLIPNPPILFRQATEKDSSEIQKDFIHVEELKRDTLIQTPIVVAPRSTTSAKTLCKSTASGNDFLKLRKNMAAKTTDDGMIEEAKKIFKSKCFTTEQVKNLGALFLTSAGKYQFFDAAYLHVIDQEKFSSLESEIKDDYYLKRFKALIGE